MNSPADVRGLMHTLTELDVDTGLVAKAEEILTTKANDIVEFEPGHAKGWNSLGNCQLQIGDTEQARKSLEKAAAADPEFKDPLFNLAAILSNKRKYSEAVPWINRLLEIDPDDTIAAELREEILREPENPRYFGVREIYEEKQIFRLTRREGSIPNFPRPEDIELVSYTVRSPSNMAYQAPISTPGNWDKEETMQIVRQIIAEGVPDQLFPCHCQRIV